MIVILFVLLCYLYVYMCNNLTLRPKHFVLRSIYVRIHNINWYYYYYTMVSYTTVAIIVTWKCGVLEKMFVNCLSTNCEYISEISPFKIFMIFFIIFGILSGSNPVVKRCALKVDGLNPCGSKYLWLSILSYVLIYIYECVIILLIPL